MANKVSEKIYMKDFHIKEVGYDVREVDSFLDDVNIDIRKLEREIDLLKKENECLRKIIKELQEEKLTLQTQITRLESSSNTKSSYNNIEMIQRLSRIEDTLHQLINVKKD